MCSGAVVGSNKKSHLYQNIKSCCVHIRHALPVERADKCNLRRKLSEPSALQRGLVWANIPSSQSTNDLVYQILMHSPPLSKSRQEEAFTWQERGCSRSQLQHTGRHKYGRRFSIRVTHFPFLFTCQESQSLRTRTLFPYKPGHTSFLQESCSGTVRQDFSCYFSIACGRSGSY